MTTISIITVNYKTLTHTRAMLVSLLRFHPDEAFEVFVIDNASGDDLSTLPSLNGRVTFIQNEKNVGFARACNQGIRLSKGEHVVLVNPDVVFTEAVLAKLVSRMRDDADVGIAGISLKNPDGTQQSCLWRFPKPWDQFLLLLKLPHLLPNLHAIKRWKMTEADYGKTQDVDQVMGAFFCIRRDLFLNIGLLDEHFFLWYEEVDYCKRARDAGWRVRFYHDLTAVHVGGASFAKVLTWKKQTILRRSLRYYMRKHHGIVVWLLFTLFDPIFWILSFGSGLLKRR